MLEGRKGHFLIIFDNFFKNFALMIFAIVAIFVKGSIDIESGSQVGTLILIAIIIPMKTWIAYVVTKYQITDKMFIVRSGLIKKSVVEVPLETITTVDFTQNLIFQFFNVQRIRVETTVQYAGKKDPNTVFALKSSDAEEFKKLILAKKRAKLQGLREELEDETYSEVKNGNTVNEGIYNIEEEDKILDVITPKVSRLILLGIIGSKKSALIELCLAIAALVSIMPMINNFFGNDFIIDEEAVDMANTVFTSTTITSILLVILAVVLILYFLFFYVVSVVHILIKYLSFTILRTENSIIIKYGAISKKSFTLTNEKISGVSIEQSLLMRVFGYCSINVFAIGYGGADSGSLSLPMLYPIGKKEEVYKVLKILIPELEIEEEYYRKKDKTLIYFFFKSSVVITLILMLGGIIASVLINMYGFEIALIIVTVIPFIFVMIDCIMEYKNVKLSCGEKTISYINGGFTRKYVLLKTNLIETVSFKSTYFKEKIGIGHIVVNVFGPLQFATGKVFNMRREDYQKIENLLKF